MKRRDALKTIGGLAGAATLARVLPACSDDDGPVGITTYVFLMMENRSYDHYLGARKLEGLPGDGLAPEMMNPNMAGEPIAPYPATLDKLCDPDPPHSWNAAHAQFNEGANDGFVRAQEMSHGSGTEPMKYMTREFLPVTWALADAYTSCDRWFCSVMGPTWPNRFYWHTGTSNGIMVNDLPSGKLTWPSINHRLHEKNLDWRYYFGNIPVAALLDETELPIEGKILRFEEFLTDAKAGKLPPVTYIDPGFFFNDDHPPVHPINGQELIASIYLALAGSPHWKNCLFVVTYDENGGYFDHVPPPKTADDHAAQGFDQLGFRVPTLVIGPYVKQGHVSSVQYDHTSALKHLELELGLDPLTMRSTAANDLSDCIDFERLAKGDWAKPIEIPVVNLLDWDTEAPACTGDEERSQGSHEPHPVIAWADANPELMARYGARRDLAEYGQKIRNFLREATSTRKA